MATAPADLKGRERSDAVRKLLSRYPRSSKTMKERMDTLIEVYTKNAYDIYKCNDSIQLLLDNNGDTHKVEHASRCMSEMQKEIHNYLENLYSTLEKIDPDAPVLLKWLNVDSLISSSLDAYESKKEGFAKRKVEPEPVVNVIEEFDALDCVDVHRRMMKRSIGEILDMASNWEGMSTNIEEVENKYTVAEKSREVLYKRLDKITQLAAGGIAGVSELYAYIESLKTVDGDVCPNT
jgi:hypothetical protein